MFNNAPSVLPNGRARNSTKVLEKLAASPEMQLEVVKEVAHDMSRMGNKQKNLRKRIPSNASDTSDTGSVPSREPIDPALLQYIQQHVKEDIFKQLEDRYAEISSKSAKFNQWFEGSTHQLVLREDAGWYRIAAFMILCLQIAAYIVMVYQAKGDLIDPSFILKATRGGCSDMHLPSDSIDAFTFDDIICDLDALKHDTWSAVGLSSIIALLLMSDLARDFVGSLHVMCHKLYNCVSDYHDGHFSRFLVQFVWAFLICAESLVACAAAVMFSLVSMQEGSSANALMNCVAVLFLHDIDEKMFPLLARFQAEKGLDGLLLCALFVVLVVVVLAMGYWLHAWAQDLE